MTLDEPTGVPAQRPRVYLEIEPADIGWRYRVLLGITEKSAGWRPTRNCAIRAGRRARQRETAQV